MLIRDNGASNVYYIVINAPTKYAVYEDRVSLFVVNKTTLIKMKEIVNSAANASALPYIPGTVTSIFQSFESAIAGVVQRR